MYKSLAQQVMEITTSPNPILFYISFTLNNQLFPLFHNTKTYISITFCKIHVTLLLTSINQYLIILIPQFIKRGVLPV